MKKYNRIYTMILVILMLAGLTACSSQGTVTGDNRSWKNVWKYSTRSALSDVGYYYSVNGGIWFADLQSGTNIPLCTKAGCSHRENSCEVYIPSIFPIFFGGDSLYSIEGINNGTTLYRRDTTGAARMKVADLGTKYTEEEKVLTISFFGCAGDYLYYCAVVSAVVYNEEVGGFGNVDEVQYISRVDLKTGKETYLFEDEVGAFYDDVRLLAVREDAVLFSHRNASDVDKHVENYIEILDKDTQTVKLWSDSTGEVTTVLETTWGEFAQEICVTEGKICYSTKLKYEDGMWKYGTCTFDLDTGKKELLYEGKSTFLGGSYLLQGTDTGKIIYDLAAGKELPWAVTEGNASIQITSDKGAVIRFYHTDTTSSEYRYYYVTREAMADGIQEEDLLYLYTKKYSA